MCVKKHGYTSDIYYTHVQLISSELYLEFKDNPLKYACFPKLNQRYAKKMAGSWKMKMGLDFASPINAYVYN